MATGTYAPAVPQQYFDNSGNPLSSGTIETFIAGTSSHLATYSDVALTIQNQNPMVLDAGGRPPAGNIFLTPGVSYKFLIKDSIGATMATPDNILAVPTSSANQNVRGTAGETLAAGQAVYLSDGSGGKTAGLWYKADSANAYSSTTPEVGMLLQSIASGSAGDVTLAGSITGLAVTIGALYYIGTAGAITATAPVNARILGQADTTTSLVLATIPPLVTVDIGLCQGRLTLTTGVPVTVSDVTAATSLFFSPYAGNRIALFSGTIWQVLTFSELTIAVPATTSQMYDVFIFNNSGTAALELLAWTNDTTRATALVTQDGVLSKTGALTRRYVGSFRTTTVSGQTEDSILKRYVWNYSNRLRRFLQRFETTATWNYTTATVRQANGSTSNQVDLVVGFAEVMVDLALNGMTVENAGGGNVLVSAGIGEDATTTYVAGSAFQDNSGMSTPISIRLVKMPVVGRHFYSWNEFSTAGGTTTWRANQTAGSTITAGLTGWIEG